MIQLFHEMFQVIECQQQQQLLIANEDPAGAKSARDANKSFNQNMEMSNNNITFISMLYLICFIYPRLHRMGCDNFLSL